MRAGHMGGHGTTAFAPMPPASRSGEIGPSQGHTPAYGVRAGGTEPPMQAVPLESIIFSLPHDLTQRLDQARGGMSRADAVGMILQALLRGSARLMPMDGNEGARSDSALPGFAGPPASDGIAMPAPPAEAPGDVAARVMRGWRTDEGEASQPLPGAWPASSREGGPWALRLRMQARQLRQRFLRSISGTRAVQITMAALCLALAGSVVLHFSLSKELETRRLTVLDLQAELVETRAKADKLLVTLTAVERDRDMLRGRLSLRDGAQRDAGPRDGGQRSGPAPAAAAPAAPEAPARASAPGIEARALPKPPRARPTPAASRP